MIIDPQMTSQAIEASRPGFAIFLDLTLAGLIVTNAGLLAREIIKAKKTKKNGGNPWPRPGLAEDCLKHRDRLITLETEGRNTKEDITEIKGDVKELLRRTPPNRST